MNAAPAAAAPEFGPATTIKVADLAVGDFVIEFPAQRGIRASEVGSGVKAITASTRGWYTRSRPRGPRFPLAARRIYFLRSDAPVLDVPSESDILVRRQIAAG